MDNATMDTLRGFVGTTQMLDVTPCEASFPNHGGQTMQMSVQNFGAQMQSFCDWNATSVRMDSLFGGPEIELNIGEPAPAMAQAAPRRPSTPSFS